MFDEVLEEVSVMMCQQILYYCQDIEGRVGKVFIPITTPIHCVNNRRRTTLTFQLAQIRSPQHHSNQDTYHSNQDTITLIKDTYHSNQDTYLKGVLWGVPTISINS